MSAGTKKYGACRWPSLKDKQNAIRNFLLKYGDDLPSEVIDAAVLPKALTHWVTRCLKSDSRHLVSAVRYEQTDWFTCTVKNLATEPGHQKQGLGTTVVEEAIQRADGKGTCHVLLADITATNAASLAVFTRKLSKDKQFTQLKQQFCFEDGEPPANMLTLVRFKPKDGLCRKGPPLPDGGMKAA